MNHILFFAAIFSSFALGAEPEIEQRLNELRWSIANCGTSIALVPNLERWGTGGTNLTEVDLWRIEESGMVSDYIEEIYGRSTDVVGERRYLSLPNAKTYLMTPPERLRLRTAEEESLVQFSIVRSENYPKALRQKVLIRRLHEASRGKKDRFFYLNVLDAVEMGDFGVVVREFVPGYEFASVGNVIEPELGLSLAYQKRVEAMLQDLRELSVSDSRVVTRPSKTLPEYEVWVGEELLLEISPAHVSVATEPFRLLYDF